jgi:uncharacterized membrane protein YkoI
MIKAMKYFFYNLALMAALACAAHNATAQHEFRQPASNEWLLAQNDRRPAPRVTMGSATGMVQQQTGGRVMNAQETRQNGRDGYRIKVLTRSGEVRVFFVDANTGAMQQD